MTMDTKQFDLDALKRQLSKGEGDGWLSMHARHIPALLAECERLQGLCDKYKTGLRNIAMASLSPTTPFEHLMQMAKMVLENPEAVKESKSFKAQRDRLRGALKKVTNAFEKHYVMPPLRKSLDIARAALAGEGDDNSE